MHIISTVGLWATVRAAGVCEHHCDSSKRRPGWPLILLLRLLCKSAAEHHQQIHISPTQVRQSLHRRSIRRGVKPWLESSVAFASAISGMGLFGSLGLRTQTRFERKSSPSTVRWCVTAPRNTPASPSHSMRALPFVLHSLLLSAHEVYESARSAWD